MLGLLGEDRRGDGEKVGRGDGEKRSSERAYPVRVFNIREYSFLDK